MTTVQIGGLPVGSQIAAVVRKVIGELARSLSAIRSSSGTHRYSKEALFLYNVLRMFRNAFHDREMKRASV